MHIRPSVSCFNTTSSGNTTMDTIYPEPMSLLHRRVVPKKRRGKTSRYRTQPVTFSEIQEVDEDNLEESTEPTVAASSRSEQDINRRFEEFIKSREKILRQLDRPLQTVVDESLTVLTTAKPTSSEDGTPPPAAINQSTRFTSRPSI